MTDSTEHEHEDRPEHDHGAVRRTLGSASAGLLGAAPHVLHHVGPLAGAALLAGAAGKVLFGVLGFALLIPMLLRMHRRSRSWRNALALALVFAAMFSVSTFVIGPAVAGDDAAVNAEPGSLESGPSNHVGHHE